VQVCDTVSDAVPCPRLYLAYVSVFVCPCVQVGVTQVDADVLQQAKEAEVVTFGSPSAVK
jgi:hypothetical protein